MNITFLPKFHLIAKIVLFGILLSGCLSVVDDPTLSGDVPFAPTIIIAPEAREGPCEDNPEIDIEHTYSLGELIDMGLQNNPLTMRSWSAAKSQAFSYYASESLYLPVVDLQEAGTLQDYRFWLVNRKDTAMVGNGGIFGYYEQWSSTLSIQYLLFDFGTRSGTVEAAKQALLAANWQHHYILQQVIYDVSISYYDYLESVAFVNSSKKNLENATKSMDAANAQFEAGIKTKVDLLQAKTDYFNAQLDLQDRKAQKKVAMAHLAQSVGLSPDTKLKVKDIPYEIESRPIKEGVEELMRYARLQRADLAAEEAIVFQKIAEEKVAWGRALPTVSADISLNNTGYSKVPISRSRNYSATVLIDFPLFNGFFNYNDIRRSKADYEAAYYDYRNSENNLLVDVITAYYQYVTADQNLKTASEYEAFAEESFQSVLQGYREGIQTIIDLLSAQNTLAAARARLIQSRAGWLRAIVNIAFTTGLLGVNAGELSIATPEMKEEPL